MATPKKKPARKPITKFPQLQKKLNQLKPGAMKPGADRGKKVPNIHHQGRRGSQGR